MDKELQAIEAELQELGLHRDKIRSRMKELTELRDEQLAAVSAQAKLEAMTPQERKALGLPEPQHVEVAEIVSEEVVNQV